MRKTYYKTPGAIKGTVSCDCSDGCVCVCTWFLIQLDSQLQKKI